MRRDPYIPASKKAEVIAYTKNVIRGKNDAISGPLQDVCCEYIFEYINNNWMEMSGYADTRYATMTRNHVMDKLRGKPDDQTELLFRKTPFRNLVTTMLAKMSSIR